MATVKVGVMGAADDTLAPEERARLAVMAEELGAALAARKCICLTGATTGLPYMVTRAARRHGALTVGVSPAASAQEHADRYGLPADAADIIVFTGFGLKGRNVVTVRSCDIVIIFGGATGTLNEFTIAYDEGKIIGVLQGSGGIADHIEELLGFVHKRTAARVLFSSDPAALLDSCLAALA
ncbi:MAG TPA: hypothetical protein VNL14_08980 [Candidatus Acidoferrales bacterium]|nr:hypothetical protein [Candidatus Acidoferrales bacterium]